MSRGGSDRMSKLATRMQSTRNPPSHLPTLHTSLSSVPMTNFETSFSPASMTACLDYRTVGVGLEPNLVDNFDSCGAFLW